MDLRLYNTLTRKKEVFRPIDPSNVRMYVCGPTVYQRIHIGNARPLVVFDVLFRLLRHLAQTKVDGNKNVWGAEHTDVTYVRNITDIDDKIVDQVRKNGVNGDLNAAVRDLTDGTTRTFHEDCAALGLLPPTHEPRATDHIPGMVKIIGELVDRGYAYAAEGHVLFHVPSMSAYGRLSGRSLDDMIAGARVEVAPYKRHPADFVLWKPSTPDLPGWDSPWGRGRPGWHIECSAMSEALLGIPFDIHGGGQDLIFPHHENEIAQSCCAHGLDRMASVWMHNGFVDMRGEKMSKSVGNVVRAWEALEAANIAPIRQGEILRLWMLSAHYRQPIDYQRVAIDQARTLLDRMYLALDKNQQLKPGQPDNEFVSRLVDDLNTPSAVARLSELASALKSEPNPHQRDLLTMRIIGCGAMLGILQKNAHHWLRDWSYRHVRGKPPTIRIRDRDILFDGSESADDVALIVEERARLRAAKAFGDADMLRHELGRLGVILEDRPDGTTDWRRA